MHLYLIRHGQAVSNVQPILGGMKGDTGLTLRGIEQAERLRDRLIATREIQADVLLSSTLPRALQTAHIIAPALGLPVIPEEDLHELRVGPEADGMALDEYKRRFGWVDLALDPFTPVDPGGESWAGFMLRVATTLTRLARDYEGKTVVAVCHGGIVDGAFIHFFGMNAHTVPPARFHTHNTSITHWMRGTHHGKLSWRLMKYNDAIHLRGQGTTERVSWMLAPTEEPLTLMTPGTEEFVAAEDPAVPLPTEPEKG